MQRMTFQEAYGVTVEPGQALIYALAEPGGGPIRYVGKTWHLRVRLRAHQNGSDNSRHKKYWIAKLVQAGQLPDFIVLEFVPCDAWKAAEIRWIAELSKTCRLTNISIGGTGISTGRKLSETHKRRIGDANRGKKHTPEFGRQVSERQRGREFTAEHRLHLSQALTGRVTSDATRAKLLASRARRPAFVPETQSSESREKRRKSITERWAMLKAQGKSWRSR